MNKKLIALAIAGAFVAPVAMADTSNVVIGGQMHFSLDSLNGANNAGTDLTRKTNVSSNASNIYFKGTEDLGNGMSAVWQVQTYFSAGGTGNADVGPAAAGYIGNNQSTKDGVSSGNTFVGLQSKSWGGVMLGKNDTPVKTLSRKVDLFNNQIGDTRNLISSAGPGKLGGTNTGTWDLRPQNMVWYASPNFNGFSAVVGYVTNAGTGAAINSGTNASLDAVTAVTGAATYENGPIYAGLGYEKHNLSNYVSNNGYNDEKIWRLVGGYNFGSFKVTGLYQEESNLTRVATTDNNVKRTTWGLGGAYNMGANTIKLQYYRAGDIRNTNYASAGDTGASMWALGVDHSLSKRTTVYAAYARTNNDNMAAYSAFGGGHGDNPGSTAPNGTTIGAKNPSGVSVGMIHNF